jgi:hypothetical protein
MVDDDGNLTRIEVSRNPETNKSSINDELEDGYRRLGMPLFPPWIRVPITLLEGITSRTPVEVKLIGKPPMCFIAVTNILFPAAEEINNANRNYFVVLNDCQGLALAVADRIIDRKSFVRQYWAWQKGMLRMMAPRDIETRPGLLESYPEQRRIPSECV